MFIRQSKLKDVKGRIDYVTNLERQEHLYATCSIADVSFWKDMAAQNQLDYKKNLGTGAHNSVAREPHGICSARPDEALRGCIFMTVMMWSASQDCITTR